MLKAILLRLVGRLVTADLILHLLELVVEKIAEQARKTDTPIDDEVVGFVEQLLKDGDYAKRLADWLESQIRGL